MFKKICLVFALATIASIPLDSFAIKTKQPQKVQTNIQTKQPQKKVVSQEPQKKAAPKVEEYASEAIVFSNAKTLDQLIKNNTYVVLDFYMDSCPPCKSFSTYLDQKVKKSKSSAKKVVFIKIHGPHNPEIFNRYKEKGTTGCYPTFIYIKNNQVVGRRGGFSTHREKVSGLNVIEEDIQKYFFQ